MPTTSSAIPLPAPVPTSLDELEALLYAEAVRHYRTLRQPPTDELPYVRGTVVGRAAGYAYGLAAAIHYITGEPVPDIVDRVMTIAGEDTRSVS